jgi:transposase-like protein
LGAELVQQLDGSAQARRRLEAILGTLSGELTVKAACHRLGLGSTRFHTLRRHALQQLLAALEPRPRGRPAARPGPQEERLAELEDQVQSLMMDLQAAQIREELALVLPHLVRRSPAGTSSKKNAVAHRRTRSVPSATPPATPGLAGADHERRR